MDTIARKSGLKTRKTVSKAISLLETYSIITVEKASAEDGKRLNNRYRLNNPKLWIGVAETPKKETKVTGISDIKVIVTPEWMDVQAWAAWEKYRKEIKKSLTDSTRRLQFSLLEKYKADHVEMINRSIQYGWRGLFPLEKKKGVLSKIQAPAGKYAEVGK